MEIMNRAVLPPNAALLRSLSDRFGLRAFLARADASVDRGTARPLKETSLGKKEVSTPIRQAATETVLGSIDFGARLIESLRGRGHRLEFCHPFFRLAAGLHRLG